MQSTTATDENNTQRPRALRSRQVRAVSETLRGYAERGAFQGFSEGRLRIAKMTFSMQWHYARTYRLVLDLEACTLSFPDLLPGVPARSPMMAELKAFLQPFSTDRVPEHRRVDARKGELQLIVRRGSLTLGLSVRNGEFAYCTRKLVNIAHEVFMVLLRDGPYYEYRVEKLGLDPDVAWA